MKATTVQIGLYAVLPQLASAGQPKWEHQRNIFQRQNIGNISIGDVGNGVDNGNTQLSANIVDSFNTNTINYYSTAPDSYYAKLCDTCNIVKVAKGNNTYVDQPCPVCPVETFHCPGYALENTTSHAVNGASGVCNYQAPVCLSCKAITPPPPPALTTIEVSSEVITCPATATSSIASIAAASGASVAKVVASSIISEATAVTITAPAIATSVAVSTVVNVECTTCPAGKAATTVAQVPATPLPGAPAPARNLTTPAAPAAPAFTGSAATLVTSIFSMALGLAVCTLL